MNKRLNQELQELREGVGTMAQSVGQSLGAATASLLAADTVAADRVCEGDRTINDQRFSLETKTVNILVTQQPVAADLRLLVGVLEIVAELERMGDYSKDIARIAIRQAPHGIPQPPDGMKQMVERAASMLDRAMGAFVSGDAQLATLVARDDNDINEWCAKLHRQLVQQAHVDEGALEEALRMLPAVHNIERFADRVTNICERIVYIATGEQIEFSDQV